MNSASHDSERDRQLEAVLHPYLQAMDAGRAPDREELLRQHPELASELTAFFANQDAVARLAHDSAEAATLAPSEAAATMAGTPVRYFGDYELLEEIARGGMGVVYRARQVSLNRPVALKMILAGQLASPQDVQRFHSEAEAAANLEHPHIVPIYEVGQQNGQHYFSMKLIEGGSLAQSPRTAVRGLVEVLIKVARAVHYAHQRGILHRDLKPANVLLDTKGEPHVTDFGLAKRVDGGSNLTQTGVIVGTPGYMAPEQARAEKGLSTAADVYSLGAILYDLLTGKPPFQAATPLDIILQVLDREPVHPLQVNPSADRDLATICLKCLEKDPARRYSSAAALADDLQRWVKGEPISARAVGRFERGWRWCRRNPALAGLAAAVVLALLGGSAASTYFGIQAAQRATLADNNAHTAGLRAEEAKHSAQVAGEERERALAQKLQAQHNAYAARAQVIQSAWQAAEMGRGLTLLERQRPVAGETDLRGFEWRYFSRLWQAETLTLETGGFTANLHGHVVFSPDGRLIATGCGEAVKIWDAMTGEVTQSLPGPSVEVTGLAFSPDGNNLAVYVLPAWPSQEDRSGIVTVWDVRSGKRLLALPDKDYDFGTIHYSPDGRFLVRADHRGIVLHDAGTGKELQVLRSRLPLYLMGGLALSPNGERLAAATAAGTVNVWDVKTGRLIQAPRGRGTYCFSLAYSPDGALLAGNFNNNFTTQITVWDAVSGQVVTTIEPRDGNDWMRGLAFSPDGTRLAGATGRTVRLWDAYRGKELRAYKGHDAAVVSVAFSPDGTRLASLSQEGTVKVWDAGLQQESFDLRNKGRPARVAFSANDRIVSTDDDFHVKVWDVGSGKETLSFNGRGRLAALACSPDGRRIVTGAQAQNLQTGLLDRFEVSVWDIGTGRNLFTYQGHTDWVTCVACSPDNALIASGSRDGTVRVHDAMTGREVHVLRGHEGWVNAVAFSPLDKQLVSVGNDSTGRAWDLADGREVFRLPMKERAGTYLALDRAGTHLAFSRDGTRLACGCFDGTTLVWDVPTRRTLITLKGPTELVAGVVFTPDGRRLVTSNSPFGKVRMWDLATGQEVLTLEVDSSEYPNLDLALAISPDGSRLATSRGRIQIWEIAPPSAEDLGRRRVAGLVDALFDGLVSKARVLQYLRDNRTLEEPFRKEALALATGYFQDAVALHAESWEIVRFARQPRGAYIKAHLQAEEACRLVPNFYRSRCTLGIACYRLGHYEEARNHLSVSQEKNQPPILDLAFLAMAHHQLGQTEAARSSLARLRTMLKADAYRYYEDVWRFLDEAEELIEGSRSSGTGQPEKPSPER